MRQRMQNQVVRFRNRATCAKVAEMRFAPGLAAQCLGHCQFAPRGSLNKSSSHLAAVSSLLSWSALLPFSCI